MFLLLIFSVFYNLNTEIFPYYGENFFGAKERGFVFSTGCFSVISKNIFDLRTSFNLIFLRKEKNSIFFKDFFIPFSKSFYPETRNIFNDEYNHLLLWVKEFSFNLKYKNIFLSAGKIPLSWELLNIFSLFSFFNPPLRFTPSSINRSGVDGFLLKFEKDFNFFEYGLFPQKNDTLHSALRLHLSPTGEKELFILFEEPEKLGIGFIFPLFSGITKIEILKKDKLDFGLGYEHFLFSKIYFNAEFYYSDDFIGLRILSFSLSYSGLRTSFSFISSYDFKNKNFILFPLITYSLKDDFNLNFSVLYYFLKNTDYPENEIYLLFAGMKIFY